MNRVILSFMWLMMVLLLVMAGCSRKATSSITTEVTDSIHVKEVTRFIPFNVPGDTVTIEKLIECDPITNKPKPFKAHKKSKKASVIVHVDESGKMTSTGICDSLNTVIEVKDREIHRLKTEKRNEVIVKEVFITRDFDKFCRWYFAITILSIVAFVFHKLKYF